jgi:lipoprotein-releasing system permease protein
MNVNCQTTAIDPLLTNGIQVWFKDYKKTDRVREILSKEFEKEGISQYFDIVPYYEYEFAKELIGQFQSDRYLFMLVGVLILTVACSNIISLLLLLVNDKKHEIGILLSLGATKKSIAFIFGGIGVTVGFISSLIGVLLAYFTLSHIDLFVNLLSTIEGRDAFNPLFYGDSLPNVMSLKALLFVLVASPLLSFFAGLIPAIKACKLKPSAILRSE